MDQKELQAQFDALDTNANGLSLEPSAAKAYAQWRGQQREPGPVWDELPKIQRDALVAVYTAGMEATPLYYSKRYTTN